MNVPLMCVRSPTSLGFYDTCQAAFRKLCCMTLLQESPKTKAKGFRTNAETKFG